MDHPVHPVETLRILQLEDSAEDAELARVHLRRAGMVFDSQCVEMRADFLAALENFKPHLVLADYKLPAFDGRGAILMVQERHPEIPVILVSGVLEDEGAVELVKLGARDFVLKDRMARLPSAVRNVLAEESERQKRIQAEVALRDSEQRFRNLIESTSDVIGIARPDGTIIYVSPAVHRVSGYEPQELVGRNYFDLVVPDDLAKSRNNVAELIRLPGVARTYESRIRHKDGSIRDTESVARYLADVPGIEGIVVNIRDITARKQAEASLRMANVLIEQSPSILFRWAASPGWPVVYVSQNVRRWGYEPEEFLSGGLLYASLIHPDDLQGVIDEVANVSASGGTVFAKEYRVITHSGEVIWLDERSVIERDAAGHPQFFQGVLADITEHKKLELQKQALYQRAQLQVEAINQIVASPALGDGDLETLAAQLTEAAARATGAERANAWLFNNGETELRCIDLFEATPGRHSSGMVLQESAFQSEFRALKNSRYVAADDPLTDPRTAGYVESYLKPLKITSMLDAVIATSGRHLGLLCIEHVDRPHHWEPDEIAFVNLLADKLGLCLANRERRQLFIELQEAQRVAHLGHWRLNPLTGETRWSEEIYRIFGLDPAGPAPTLTQHPNLMSAESFARLDAAIAECLRSGTPYEIELELTAHPSDKHRWIAARGEAVHDDGGAVVAVRGTAQDITARKRSELALRSSQQIVESILNAMPVRVFWKDRNLVYQGCNTVFARDAGFSEPGDLIGKDDFQMGWREQAELYRADDLKVIDSGQAKLFIEEPQTTPDGKTITLLTSKLPLRDASGAISGVLGTYMDITEHKQRELDLQRTTRALRALSRGSGTLIHADSEAQLHDEMCRAIIEAGGYRMAWIGVMEQDAARSVRPVAVTGGGEEYVRQASISWADTPRGGGPVGRCIRSGQPQMVRDIASDPNMAPWQALAREYGYRSAVALPLTDAKGVFGALAIYSGDVGAFDRDEIALLSEMAADLSYGIATLRARAARQLAEETLHRALTGTIESIAATMEMRDPYTAGHERRVAGLATAIATELGLPAAAVEGIRFGALIHDLGKIHVPAEILSKPTRLSKLEYEMIKTHPQAGYDIIKNIQFPWPVALMVLQHHERLDGSGYPLGLKGDAIDPSAKILAVADVVEAMSSHRPYRPGKGIDAALAEIEGKKGLWFDAAAVDACLKLFREKHFDFEKD